MQQMGAAVVVTGAAVKHLPMNSNDPDPSFSQWTRGLEGNRWEVWG